MSNSSCTAAFTATSASEFISVSHGKGRTLLCGKCRHRCASPAQVIRCHIRHRPGGYLGSLHRAGPKVEASMRFDGWWPWRPFGQASELHPTSQDANVSVRSLSIKALSEVASIGQVIPIGGNCLFGEMARAGCGRALRPPGPWRGSRWSSRRRGRAHGAAIRR